MNDNDRRRLLLTMRSILSIASALVAIYLIVSRIYQFGNSFALSVLFLILAVAVEAINVLLKDAIDLMANGLMFLVMITFIMMRFIG